MQVIHFCVGKDKAKGQIYNVQDAQSISFEGLAKICGKAMGMKEADVQIKMYDSKEFDFGKKKAFPMREQHFFCGVDKAMIDLEWTPKYNMLGGLKDAYENDFKVKKAMGGLDLDFSTDDMVLNDDRIAVKMYTAMPADVV